MPIPEVLSENTERSKEFWNSQIEATYTRLRCTPIDTLVQTCYDKIQELYSDPDSINYYLFRQGPLLDALDHMQDNSIIITKFVEYIQLMTDNPAARKNQDKVLELTLYAIARNERLRRTNIHDIINLYKNSLNKRIDITDMYHNALSFHGHFITSHSTKQSWTQYFQEAYSADSPHQDGDEAPSPKPSDVLHRQKKGRGRFSS